MAFESIAEFLAMGRHGPYVWSCYGFAAACFAYLGLEDRWRRAALVKQIQRQRRRGQV